MKRHLAVLLAVIFLACAATAVTVVSVINSEIHRRSDLPATVTVEVSPGESLKHVAARLHDAGLIQSERVFLWMAFWKKTDRTMKFGRHEFSGTVSMDSVLAELGHAPKPILRVTIPEGLTLREIGRLLEEAGAASAASYVAVACSEEFRQAAGAAAGASCGEGFLFPDTYDLVPGMSPGEIVDLQLDRLHEILRQVASATAPAAAGMPSSGGGGPAPGVLSLERLPELLTLASIVEKETARPEERPLIAAVFYNRLKAGMPLQTDPTVIYGVIDSGLPWDGNLTRAHLTTATPYNTYMRKGLPPGPICNPGRASILAVLRPASSADLYFVSRGDGSHEFSRNLDDHNRAVRRYQLH